MSNTDIQHSAHKGLWIRISETPSSFKVENMSTDEKEIACYKSKLLLEEPIYFFCGKATDTMKDLLRVNKDLVSQALRLQEHEKEVNERLQYWCEQNEKQDRREKDLDNRERYCKAQVKELKEEAQRLHEIEQKGKERMPHAERELSVERYTLEVRERELKDREIDLCDEVDLSKKYPEDRMIFCMPDGLELSLDRRYLKTIERTTSWENLK